MAFIAVSFEMLFETQPHKLPVVNLDSLVQHQQEKKIKRHGSLFPDNIRAVFCGPSNCIHLITRSNFASK